MPVLDTEALFGTWTRDRHHAATHRRLAELKDRDEPRYAPDSALLEVQLVLRGLSKPPPAIRRAFLALRHKLANYGVSEVRTLGLDTLALQTELEERHGLTYFDSLIAASALTLDSMILSDDDAFDRVGGLVRIPLTPGQS